MVYQSNIKSHSELPRSQRRLWRWWKLPVPQTPVPSINEMIEPIPTNVEWNDPDETDHLLAMMTDRNLAKVESAILEQPSVGFLYKRMRHGVQRAEVRFDGVAGCLRTPDGGSSRQTVLIANDLGLSSRLLSPREAARLMGVPDAFRLPTNYNDSYRAIGDGVAVPVVRWLSQHLLEPLAQLCRESAERPTAAELI